MKKTVVNLLLIPSIIIISVVNGIIINNNSTAELINNLKGKEIVVSQTTGIIKSAAVSKIPVTSAGTVEIVIEGDERESVVTTTFHSAVIIPTKSTTVTTTISTTISTTKSTTKSTTTTTTTTRSATPTAILGIKPGSYCQQNIYQFFCNGKNKYARCVHNVWIVGDCPRGTECQNGLCRIPVNPRLSLSNHLFEGIEMDQPSKKRPHLGRERKLAITFDDESKLYERKKKPHHHSRHHLFCR